MGPHEFSSLDIQNNEKEEMSTAINAIEFH